MVELLINGNRIELKSSGSDITYNMQIADVFDIASVSSSYTNSFSIPKTPNNTYVFEQLGIQGSSSKIPYNKIPASIKNNGFDVVTNGWLDIKETASEYKVNIIDGMIDFFKDIENKTIGLDLNLSEFNTDKTIQNVIDSFKPEEINTKYILADYNGKNIGTVGLNSGINIDYLVPSFRVGRIFDLIFETFGYSYLPSEIPSIQDLYITYPLPPAQLETGTLIGTFNKGLFQNETNLTQKYGGAYAKNQAFWSSYNITSTDIKVGLDNWLVTINKTGGYSATIKTTAYSKLFSVVTRVKVSLYKNGELIATEITKDSETPTDIKINFSAKEGDVLEYFLSTQKNYTSISHLSTEFKIYSVNLGNISLSNAFADFKIKDFFKEILWRTALIPVINNLTKHISFIPLSARLNKLNGIDWSDKFIERTSETYTIDGYSQKNAFTLLHNTESDLYGNGYLYVNNQNIPDQQTIVESKIYAPELEKYDFKPREGSAVVTTDKYKLWDKESKENEETGETEIDYKPLSGKFYFLRFKESDFLPWTFLSEVLQGGQNISARVPYAVNNDTLFDEIIFNKYAEYTNILTNFKAKKISLKLSVIDILNLNMLVPYYFKQEAQYFILNKLTYKEGSVAQGEFILIN